MSISLYTFLEMMSLFFVCHYIRHNTKLLHNFNSVVSTLLEVRTTRWNCGSETKNLMPYVRIEMKNHCSISITALFIFTFKDTKKKLRLFWPRAMLKGLKGSFVVGVIVLVLGVVETWAKNVPYRTQNVPNESAPNGTKNVLKRTKILILCGKL